MNLYIMSRGRAGKVHTWNSIPRSKKSSAYIVVSHGEKAAYDDYYPSANVIEAPSSVTNYSQKFQFLVKGGGKRMMPKFVIMDDDLWFSKRVGDKLLKCQDIEADMTDMWNQVEGLLEKFPLVGIHPRQMGHNKELPYVVNGKVICIQGINQKLLPKDLPPLDRFPILADVILNCSLLSTGYPNALLTSYVQDHGSCQAPGGCSIYRTPEMQREAVEWVAQQFAPFAKAVIKKPKSAKWMGDERVDLTVQWKRMYEHGLLVRERETFI